MKLKVIYPPRFESEKRYVIDTIFRHFFKMDDILLEFSNKINPKEVHLVCETGSSTQRLILSNVLFGFDESAWLTEKTLPHTPFEYIDLEGIEGDFLFNSIPVLFGKASAKLVYEENGSLKCDIDIFGSIFFLLTLYEEVVINKYDEHGRFNYLDSIIYKSGLFCRPVVNEYLEVLKSLISKVGLTSIGNVRRYQLILSHDVDVLFSHDVSLLNFLKNIFADLILRKSLFTFLKKIGARVIPTKQIKYKLDPYNNLQYLMEISEKFSIKSFFNFIVVNGKGNIDGQIEILDPYYKNLLTEIYQRGHVIGLHPSYDTFDNLEYLRSQFQKFKQLLEDLAIPTSWLGGRQHYLRWKNPVTWQIWEDVGLKYDSSIGSEYFFGFRAGTCFEYPVFNLSSRESLNLIEYPLLVMDICGFKLKSQEEMNNKIIAIANICKFYKGNMTLLFHNNYVVTKSQQASYRKLVSALI